MKVLTDNQGLASDVQRMHGTTSVFQHILPLYELAAQHDIELQVEWRPREHQLLQYADMHSKLVDVADLAVSPAAFAAVCNAWHVTDTFS